ncbi:hypothetical protein C6P40_004949 [Pichia californica]|uniref:Uncharacterized protein n=1 Tax=Pichia californica TaxID=460514 RepID=A0A9P6WLS7_9ASCO|nr:hypothetical protein C6P42_000571 [[Candida] californica]KAG0689490.1 hypothetical protein C6P40_004949 [[Candida] californica]
MHLSCYETLSQLVDALGSGLICNDSSNTNNNSSKTRVMIVTLRNENDENEENENDDDDDDEDQGVQDELRIPINFNSTTPRAWNKYYLNTDVCILNSLKLQDIIWIINRQILRMKLKTNDEINNEIFIINGLIHCISILFFKCVKFKKIEYLNLNFQLVYEILLKLKKLDKILNKNIQINDTNEIWDLIDKIFLPCNENLNYIDLVNYLTNNDNDDEKKEILGSQKFVSLKYLLNTFGIKKDINTFI